MRLIFAILCWLVAGGAAAADVQVHGLRSWIDADHTRLVLDLTGPVEHSVFPLTGPDRLVLDLTGARLAHPLEQPPPRHRILSAVRAAESAGDLRIVLDLKGPVRARSLLLRPDERYGHRLVIDLYPGTAADRAASDPLDQVLVALAAGRDPALPNAAERLEKSMPATPPSGSPERRAAAPPPPAAAAPPSVPVDAGAATGGAAGPAGGAAPASKSPPSKLPAAAGTVPVPAARAAAAATETGRAPARPAREPTPLRDVVIAIDAGHGGQDPGAIGPGGTHEKSVTLAIARELRDLIQQERGMRPVMIRSGDYYLRLRTRIDIARKHKADLFLSIHADAFNDRSVRGSSVYTLSPGGATSEAARWLAARENAADLVGGVDLDRRDQLLASVLLDMSQTATIDASLRVGGHVLAALGRVGRVHKPVVQQAGFAVLKSPDIPSILVETAFISNPEEEKRLRDRSEQRRLAMAMLEGIKAYFSQHAPADSLLAAREHTIVPGDTLADVARQYQVSAEQLRVANRIRGNRLNVGNVLRIPAEQGS